MSKLKQHIDIEGFAIENLDTSELDDILDWLPNNDVFDLNIAEQGVIKSLHAENICQEYIAKIDRFLGKKDSERNKAWADAALNRANLAGHKTAKDREWFALADDAYQSVVNEITLAKAAKKWFENKADYFRNWHYAFKTFLKRDYSLERLGNIEANGYNGYSDEKSRPGDSDDWAETEASLFKE